MAFDAFGVLIGQYNAALPNLGAGDYAVLSLDINGRAIVVATDFDIRDLSAAQDNVAISDGVDTLAINADGSINISDGGGSITVDATDLDIRDLTHISDSVQIGDGVDLLAINADGSINIGGSALTALQLLDDIVLTEDAAHVSGDKGVMALVVRKDVVGTLVSADGDYSPLQVDANGNLRVTGSFTANVDDVFESGTEADTCSDSAGDGIVPITNAWTDVLTKAVGAGVSFYITGLDFACDQSAGYELVIDDNGVITERIRVGAVAAGAPDINKAFERAIEIAGQADRSLKIRGIALQAANANASAALNGYTR